MCIDEKAEYKKILENKNLELMKIDYELMQNRDKKRYELIKVSPRTISTKYGSLTINRRIYRYYNNETQKWEYIALLGMHKMNAGNKSRKINKFKITEPLRFYFAFQKQTTD
ncbi:UPF0236 family transposase-like protein [Williamsoniiplasma luminosum]|uniref:Uncharacterized protein n=1 Tax=Williamsoniiplasma luminosum TaxID=214888 RepID=A0A2S0NL03_9MOLU|nr:UPF0236 family protein [Williamsoniiplasma luminosum]AVP49701.1 MAG: hypothetical protein C5T88_03950 [Williamsoniiplasma luminosum]